MNICPRDGAFVPFVPCVPVVSSRARDVEFGIVERASTEIVARFPVIESSRRRVTSFGFVPIA